MGRHPGQRRTLSLVSALAVLLLACEVRGTSLLKAAKRPLFDPDLAFDQDSTAAASFLGDSSLSGFDEQVLKTNLDFLSCRSIMVFFSPWLLNTMSMGISRDMICKYGRNLSVLDGGSLEDWVSTVYRGVSSGVNLDLFCFATLGWGIVGHRLGGDRDRAGVIWCKIQIFGGSEL